MAARNDLQNFEPTFIRIPLPVERKNAPADEKSIISSAPIIAERMRARRSKLSDGCGFDDSAVSHTQSSSKILILLKIVKKKSRTKLHKKWGNQWEQFSLGCLFLPNLTCGAHLGFKSQHIFILGVSCLAQTKFIISLVPLFSVNSVEIITYCCQTMHCIWSKDSTLSHRSCLKAKSVHCKEPTNDFSWTFEPRHSHNGNLFLSDLESEAKYCWKIKEIIKSNCQS